MPKKRRLIMNTLRRPPLVYKYRPSGVPSFFLYSTYIPEYEVEEEVTRN